MTNAEKLTLAKHACHIRMGVIEGTHSAKCGHPGGKLGHQVLQIQRNLAVCPITALVDAILGDIFAFSGVHAEFGNDGKAHILQQPQLH